VVDGWVMAVAVAVAVVVRRTLQIKQENKRSRFFNQILFKFRFILAFIYRKEVLN